MGLCWGKEYILCLKPSEQTQASLPPSWSPQDFPETVNCHPNPPGQRSCSPQVLAWLSNQSWQSRVPKLPNL